ncbi:unnamed protein product, partial [Heterosigma akashiwo]
ELPSSSTLLAGKIHDAVAALELETRREGPGNGHQDSTLMDKDHGTWRALFNTLASSVEFREDFWQKAPLYIERPFEFIDGCFTLDEQVR